MSEKTEKPKTDEGPAESVLMNLLSCPFCGGEAKIEEIGAVPGRFCVRCQSCWAKSVFLDEYEKTKLIKAWNQRAI